MEAKEYFEECKTAAKENLYKQLKLIEDASFENFGCTLSEEERNQFMRTDSAEENDLIDFSESTLKNKIKKYFKKKFSKNATDFLNID